MIFLRDLWAVHKIENLVIVIRKGSLVLSVDYNSTQAEKSSFRLDLAFGIDPVWLVLDS